MPSIGDDALKIVMRVAENAAPYILALVAAKGEKGAIEEIKKLTAQKQAARDERVKKKFKSKKKTS